jgi:hypothetical protein
MIYRLRPRNKIRVLSKLHIHPFIKKSIARNSIFFFEEYDLVFRRFDFFRDVRKSILYYPMKGLYQNFLGRFALSLKKYLYHNEIYDDIEKKGFPILDMTNPDTQEFLRAAIKRITFDWGYEYLKLDGLWSGMATKIRYPDPKYGPDDMGDAIFYNKSKTNIEAFREGLTIVRESAKPGTFLLGCNVAQNFRTLGSSMGLLDAMRIGRDVGAKWDAIIPCIEMSSRLYFLHGRVWYNDPDCLMLRKPLTIEQAQAWASWIVMTGNLNIVSEWLPRLPKERMDIFLRSIPNTNLVGRPIDILENDPARIWLLSQPGSKNAYQ